MNAATSERCGFDWGRIERRDGSWYAICPCGWEGPPRSHPMDCGPDLLDHQNDTTTMCGCTRHRPEIGCVRHDPELRKTAA